MQLLNFNIIIISMMNITLCISSQDWIILQWPNNNCYQCTNHFKNNGYQCAGDKSIFVPRLNYRATHYTVYSIGSIRSKRCLFLSASHSLSRCLCIVVIYTIQSEVETFVPRKLPFCPGRWCFSVETPSCLCLRSRKFFAFRGIGYKCKDFFHPEKRWWKVGIFSM